MRHLYLPLIILLLLPGFSRAQQNQNSQSFTLEQCIQYALENSTTVKNAWLDEEIADARVKETRGIGLPQIDASIGITHNQKLPRFFGTYMEPDPNNPNQFSLIPPMPGLQSGDIVAGQNFFQLKSSGNAGLSISQILFNGSYLVGLKAASAYRELSVRSSQQTKEQTIQQVMKAYYGVIINKDRIQLFDNNLSRVEQLLKTTKALNENGFSESIDVDRLQVTLNNLKSEREKFVNLQELSLHLLKFQMNYPMTDPLDVQGDISSLTVDENVLQEYSVEWDYKKRTDYAVLETNRKLLSLDVKNKFAAGLPSLVAFANLGYSTQSNNISGIFQTNTGQPLNGWENGAGPDKWYSFSSFGVTLNVPVFSGLQRTYRLQQSKLSLQKTENSMLSLKSAIDLEIKQSAIGYLNSVTSLKSQNENMKLAENIAKVTRIKYEQGVGSNIEVIDAESSLKESQINYYNALYDALVAKVDLDKAYGKLNPQTSTENK
jgi:outer membrane protein